MSSAELLRERNEKLEELWLLDQQLREFTSKRTVVYKETMVERRLLCTELRQLRAAPWTFDPRRDNSWLPSERRRASN